MRKAAELEGLEAYRLLFRRYEPVSTVTKVSKLVDWLITTFSGDLMNSLTDFEGRVTSWEHEAKETLSDLIKFGVVIRGLEKRDFRDHLLINTAGTTEKTKFVKEIGIVEPTRRNTQPVPKAVKIKSSKETVHGVELTATWREIVERKLNTCKKTQTSGWSGTDDKGKGKPGKGKGQGKQDKDKGRCKLGKDKGKNKKKGRCKHHGKKGKKRFHEMEGHEDKQERQIGHENAEWTDWRSSDWSTDLWNDLACERSARLLPSTQRLKNSPIQRMEEAFQW